MVMAFETDVFVDTEAYDTCRILVVNIFFSKLFWHCRVGQISHCAASRNSAGTCAAGLFLNPENFTRTDLQTETSYRVSACMADCLIVC